MRRIAGKDTPQKVRRFAVLGHPAASPMRDGYYAIHVGIGAEDVRGKVGSDAAGDCSRAVHSGQDAYVVAGGDAAVGADDALEGGSCGGIEQFCGASFRAYGVVAVEVTGDEVVGVDVISGGDRLGCETYDLVELADWLAGANGPDGDFVPRRDIG